MWETKKLGDVCETGAGGTPLKSKKEYYDSGTIPWLLSGEVSQRDIRRAKCFISDAGLKNSSAKLFPVNTVLVAMYGATAGQVGILRFEACTNQAVCGILPNQQTIPEFIYYTFLLKKNELVATASGNAQPNISQTKIKNTLIPLPPLPEQRRIVGILDEAFAGIDKIIANTEQNLSNARELFESYLNNAFTQKADGWSYRKLGELFEFKNGINFTKEERSDEGFLTIDVRNMYCDGTTVSLDDLYRVNKQVSSDYLLIENDVLFVRSSVKREGVGWPAVFISHHEPVTFCGFIIRARPIQSGEYNSNLLIHYLRQNVVRERLVSLSKQATITNVNQRALADFLVLVPPRNEQPRLLDQLDQLSSATQRLEAIYQQKLDALNELKQSILHKAFRGELPGGAPAAP